MLLGASYLHITHWHVSSITWRSYSAETFISENFVVAITDFQPCSVESLSIVSKDSRIQRCILTLDAWSPCPEALSSRVVRMKSSSWVHVFVRVCLVPFPRYHHSYSGWLSFSANTSVFRENFYTTVKLRYKQSFRPFVKYLMLHHFLRHMV